MAWFSSQIHPPIIASNLLNISPWASFLLLKIEPKIFVDFYDHFEASMGKHLQRSVEEALKVSFILSKFFYY